MTADSESDSIEACRTCGTYYFTTSNYLRPIFTLPTTAMEDSENADSEFIRSCLAAWEIEIDENDELSHYICLCCSYEFQKICKFRQVCQEAQERLREMCNMREMNQIRVKQEMPDPTEVEARDTWTFIFVDDDSDDEKQQRAVSPFKVPHVPIKQELIEQPVVAGAANASENALENGTNAELNLEVDAVPEFLEQPQSQELQATPAPQSPPAKKQKRSNSELRVEKLEHEVWELKQAYKRETRKCKICDEAVSRRRYKRHMRKHRMVADWRCSICENVYATEAECQEHMQIHENNEHYMEAENEMAPPASTEYEAQEYEYNYDIDEAETVTNDECNNTDNTTQEDEELEEQEEEDLQEESSQFACAHCTAMFDSIIDLCEHSSLHASNPIPPRHECGLCGKVYKLKFQLNRHLTNHKVSF